ncbi:response regulator [Spirosoma soli]|uniref:Response regulator n=1 Tax=Spirosoma soli TaxID=1770529 RepID=A0ABW5LXT9_9BACT
MNRHKQPIRLLVVDDQDDQWHLIEWAFRQGLPTAHITRVTTHSEAVSYLTDCLAQGWNFPDLVLLDLYMPKRQDGWQTLEAIRTLPVPLDRIPVVMLSSSDEPDDIREAYEHGCSSYMIKPTTQLEWLNYFQALQTYWWDTVSAPPMSHLI